MLPSVIFDMDGVILDTERLILDCWRETAACHNINGIEEIVYKCIGTNDTKTRQLVCAFLGNSFDYDRLRSEVSARFAEITSVSGIPLKPGVFELLDYLHSKNVKTGLASSTHIDKVSAQLRGAAVYDYFDVLVGGNMVSRSKPEPDIFLHCAGLMGASPDSTFVIEDSFNGVRAASRAGMKPIMVPDLVPADNEIAPLTFSIQPDLSHVKLFFINQKIF